MKVFLAIALLLPAIDARYGISSTGKKIWGWSTPMKPRPIFMGSPSPFQGGGFQGRADAEVMMRDATEKLPAIDDRRYGISSTGKRIRGWSTPMKKRPIFMGSPSPFQGGGFQGRADAEVMMRDATEKLQDEDESGEYERDESGEYGSGENDGEDEDESGEYESGEDDGEDKDESGEYKRDESGEDESGEDDTKEDEDFEPGKECRIPHFWVI